MAKFILLTNWLVILAVVVLSSNAVNGQNGLREFYNLVTNQDILITDHRPYSMLVDVKRSLLLVVMNKPLDPQFIASIISASKPPSNATIEQLLKSFNKIHVDKLKLTLMHPVGRLVLPFENETDVVEGQERKQLQLTMLEETSLLTLDHLAIDFQHIETIDGLIHTVPHFTDSTLKIDPPVKALYSGNTEQQVAEVYTFSQDCKTEVECNELEQRRMFTRVSEYSKIGVPFSFRRIISSWFSSVFGPDKTKSNTNDDNSAFNDDSSAVTFNGSYLDLNNMTFEKLELQSRGDDFRLIYFWPHFAFELNFIENSKFSIDNFIMTHMRGKNRQTIQYDINLPTIGLSKGLTAYGVSWKRRFDTPPLTVGVLIPEVNYGTTSVNLKAHADMKIPRIDIDYNGVEGYCNIGKLQLPEVIVDYHWQGLNLNSLLTVGGKSNFQLKFKLKSLLD